MKLKEIMDELLRKHSPETKAKMSAAHKGIPLTEEHKRKISRAHKGKKLSEETKRKIREAHIGFKHSDETKMKMSKSKSGKNHPLSKYTLWDNRKCHFNRSDIHGDSPIRCFATKYNGEKLPIGMNMDFVTCELIYDLIDEEVKKNEIE